VTRLKRGTHRISHTYRRPGRYRITVLVFDRAGNVTRLVSKLKVVKSPPRGEHSTTTITTVAPAPTPPGTTPPGPTSGGAAKHTVKR
jgi:hypothetical protein